MLRLKHFEVALKLLFEITISIHVETKKKCFSAYTDVTYTEQEIKMLC